MKRDLSLIRLMLLRIEELAGIKPELNLADFADLPATRECLLFHTRLLIEARFIRACIVERKQEARIVRLTFAGCDYLDAIRDDDVWHKIREHLKSFGNSAAIETVKALADRFVLDF